MNAPEVLTAYYMDEPEPDGDGYTYWVENAAGQVVVGGTRETLSVPDALRRRGFTVLDDFRLSPDGDPDEPVYFAPVTGVDKWNPGGAG